ncbi:MAG: DUF1566 domain-containing protein, partial [Myxococcota bacterium]|nr:DUF1566 domain-containing protein [Myxococcota bacterium]
MTFSLSCSDESPQNETTHGFVDQAQPIQKLEQGVDIVFGLGYDCDDTDDCGSAFCVDGVCCESACDGLCMGCVRSQTGFEDGQCEPVAVDTDPEGECTDSRTEGEDPDGDGDAGYKYSCGTTGVCSGIKNGTTSSCALEPVGTICLPPRCNRSEFVLNQECVWDTDCGPYSRCIDYQCTTDPRRRQFVLRESYCNGLGACNVEYGSGAISLDCSNYACADYVNAGTSEWPIPPDSVTCESGCAGDDDCNTGYRCDDQTECVPDSKIEPGQECISNAQCSSGKCDMGICCESDCATCQTCNPLYWVKNCTNGECVDGSLCTSSSDCQSLENSTGTCRNVRNDDALIWTRTSGGALECAQNSFEQCGTDGHCNGSGGCRYWEPGTLCHPPYCSCSEDGTSCFAQESVSVCSAVSDGTQSCNKSSCTKISTSCNCSDSNNYGVDVLLSDTCECSNMEDVSCALGQGIVQCGLYGCDGNNTTCLLACQQTAECTALAYCAEGTCEPKKEKGFSCGLDEECLTDYCAKNYWDGSAAQVGVSTGVCCDAGCRGTLEATNDAATGIFGCKVCDNLGECSNTAVDTDPFDVCAAPGVSSSERCQKGTCDGNGYCDYHGREGENYVCASGCKDKLNVYDTKYCEYLTASHSAFCPANTSTDCGLFSCDQTGGTNECFRTCTPNSGSLDSSQCESHDIVCIDQICIDKYGLGVDCENDSQCASGNCKPFYDASFAISGDSEKKCCEATCSSTSPCQGCNANGLCTSLPAGVNARTNDCDPDENDPCGFSGQCDGAGACGYAPSGTECQAAVCSGSSKQFAYYCNTTVPTQPGTCGPSAQDVSCNDYNCFISSGEPSCYSACEYSGQCVNGAYCFDGECKTNHPSKALAIWDIKFQAVSVVEQFVFSLDQTSHLWDSFPNDCLGATEERAYCEPGHVMVGFEPYSSMQGFKLVCGELESDGSIAIPATQSGDNKLLRGQALGVADPQQLCTSPEYVNKIDYESDGSALSSFQASCGVGSMRSGDVLAWGSSGNSSNVTSDCESNEAVVGIKAQLMGDRICSMAVRCASVVGVEIDATAEAVTWAHPMAFDPDDVDTIVWQTISGADKEGNQAKWQADSADFSGNDSYSYTVDNASYYGTGSAWQADVNIVVGRTAPFFMDSSSGLIWMKCPQGMIYNVVSDTCEGVMDKFNYCHHNSNACNGDIFDALVKIDGDAPGGTCPYGGIKIKGALDANYNGALDWIELSPGGEYYEDPLLGHRSTTYGKYVCALENQGATVNFIHEPAGPNCLFGGQKIEINNGWLYNDSGTTDQTEDYFCDGDYVIGAGQHRPEHDHGILRAGGLFDTCNDLNRGGQTGWRVPTLDELKSMTRCADGSTPKSVDVPFGTPPYKSWQCDDQIESQSIIDLIPHPEFKAISDPTSGLRVWSANAGVHGSILTPTTAKAAFLNFYGSTFLQDGTYNVDRFDSNSAGDPINQYGVFCVNGPPEQMPQEIDPNSTCIDQGDGTCIWTCNEGYHYHHSSLGQVSEYQASEDCKTCHLDFCVPPSFSDPQVYDQWGKPLFSEHGTYVAEYSEDTYHDHSRAWPAFGSKATFSCKNGYYLSGEAERYCVAGGEWSDSMDAESSREFPLCEPCTTVANCKANKITCTNDTDQVCSECQDGYVGDGSPTGTATCLVDCGSLSNTITDGTVVLDGGATTHGSTASVQCNSGYYREGTSPLKCEDTGSWEWESNTSPTCLPCTTVANCEAVTCTNSCAASYHYIAPGRVNQSHWNNKPESICTDPTSNQGAESGVGYASAYGTDITVTCCNSSGSSGARPGCERPKTYAEAVEICENAGYRLCTLDEMLNEVTRGTGCNFDNSYNWVSDTCDPPSNDVNSGGAVGCSISSSCESGYAGDQVTCTSATDQVCTTCKDGYVGDGSATCTIKSCDALTTANGSVAYTGDDLGNNNSHTFGATATLSCDDGYYLSSDVTPTCNANGAWSGALPSCNVCNDVSHCAGTVTCTSNSNQVCNQCADGYVGDNTNTCTFYAPGAACPPGALYGQSCYPIMPTGITECYDESSAISCPGTPGGSSYPIFGQWYLVFRQTSPYLWTSHQSFSLNAGDPENDNYSILDTITDFKSADGTYRFKYVDPDTGDYNDWRQTNNLTNEAQAGYSSVDVAFDARGFEGLAPTSREETHIDGTVNDNWWYAIAATYKGSNGFPGLDRWQEKVELYAMKEWSDHSSTCKDTEFCGQDGQYPDVPNPRYTCINANGADVACSTPPSATGETVYDNFTGLTWQRHEPTTKTVSEAESACTSLNAGGLTSWRMPTITELRTLLNW